MYTALLLYMISMQSRLKLSGLESMKAGLCLLIRRVFLEVCKCLITVYQIFQSCRSITASQRLCANRELEMRELWKTCYEYIVVRGLSEYVGTTQT